MKKFTNDRIIENALCQLVGRLIRQNSNLRRKDDNGKPREVLFHVSMNLKG